MYQYLTEPHPSKPTHTSNPSTESYLFSHLTVFHSCTMQPWVGYPSAEQSSFAEFPTGRAITFCWSLSFGTVNLGAAAKRQGRYTQTSRKRPSKMRRLSGRLRDVVANEKRPQGFSSEKMSDVRCNLLHAVSKVTICAVPCCYLSL